jgi:membrane protease YdiL (CAAX protease family)
MKNHPILAYIALTMLWSGSMWSLLFLFISPGGLARNPPAPAFIFVFLGLFGPTIGSLVTTRVIYGREGLRAMRRRLNPRGIGRWWWALLVIPAITAVTPLLRWLAGYELDGGAMLGAIVPGLGIGIMAGIFEEIGWRGFLLPHLLKRYSPLTATLLLGLIWGGLWHGYADIFGVNHQGWVLLLMILLLGPVLLTAWSVIITWVYEHTQGNLLLSILMHTSLSSSAFALGLKYTSVQDELLWTAISTGVACLGALFIWFVVRRQERPVLKTRMETAA